ncbi:MAG: NifU family protein [Acidimicrobiia bacterium]|nr:NifU family protein [Acidimicrobiia bacterium]
MTAADTAADLDGDSRPDEPVRDPQRPLAVTGAALETVLEVRAGEDDPGATALRVAITGSNMTDFVYALDLVGIAEAADDDVVYTQGAHDELTVIVPVDSVENMVGAALDVPANSAAGGLVIRNPNTPDPLAGLDLDLTGELPEKVQAVLDQAINPALGAHGGFAKLVGIEHTRVFVTMGGGCQGCAASAMTLRDGIRSMLMDSLPEITDVIDATDHSAGENPFYT